MKHQVAVDSIEDNFVAIARQESEHMLWKICCENMTISRIYKHVMWIPTSSVFQTITRSSQEVGLRGEMSTCSLGLTWIICKQQYWHETIEEWCIYACAGRCLLRLQDFYKRKEIIHAWSWLIAKLYPNGHAFQSQFQSFSFYASLFVIIITKSIHHYLGKGISMGNISTQSSIFPCSIPGLSGLYRARVSMCSGTSSLPTW